MGERKWLIAAIASGAYLSRIQERHVGFQWDYFSWEIHEPSRLRLRADDILKTHPAPARNTSTVESFVNYADTAYLSCRVLMLASMFTHAEALYCAAQTLEKYMKALLLQRDGAVPVFAHNLAKYAKVLGDEFVASEFLEVCERLSPMAEAGRYPDHKLQGWGHPIELLAFLDSFVSHCRDLLSLPTGTRNIINELLNQEPNGNPVMAAAITAVRDKNHFLDVLTRFEAKT
jgi:HEPN domain-containing protein